MADDYGIGEATNGHATVGQSTSGSLEAPGDRDWFSVTLEEGRMYDLSLLVQDDTNSDWYIYLHLNDDDGPLTMSRLSSYIDGIQRHHLYFVPSYTGKFFIEVDPVFDSTIGDYLLAVETLGDPELDPSLRAAYMSRPGNRWASDSPVQFSFYTSAPLDHLGGFSAFSAAQQLAARSVFELISDVADIDFLEIADPGNNGTRESPLLGMYVSSNLSSAGLTATASSSSFGLDPNFYFYRVDIAINAIDQSTSFGSYGYHTILHEILHASGLSHPGEYGVTDSNWLGDQVYIQDSGVYTALSYISSGEMGVDHQGMWASTPLLDDISALQFLYGANSKTRLEDNVYGFNSNAGRGAFDFTLNTKPVLAIWDAGGQDTLDLSGFSQAANIDLREGSLSSAGGLQQNIAIALGTLVENAVGGIGADVIMGNAAANRLTGGRGGDSLSGGAGNDIFVVTALADISSRDTISDFGPGDRIDLSALSGATFLVGATFSGKAGEIRYSWQLGGTLIEVDIDGDRDADGSIILSSGEFSLMETTSGSGVVVLSGTSFSFGGPEDDLLDGVAGNDFRDGGEGVDGAEFANLAKDYAWWREDDGSWRVQDLRNGSPEGTDTLVSIEQLQFADRTIKLAGATAAEQLNLAFEQVMRITTPTGADATFLNGLIAAVDGGQKTLQAAYGEIAQRADGSTAVAAMTYQFFLDFVPSKGGFDYLVSPTGPNPNNINSAYYQFFSQENRYINFAVNVGSAGDGKAAFTAEYGSLTLRQATAKAYQEIFGGSAPNEAFLNLLLDAPVEGGMTRKDYFAYYGGDGLTGLGTKAAMVGWLLTEAAKADVGTLVKASNAYFTDLADGAEFLVDIVGVYAQPDWAHNPPAG